MKQKTMYLCDSCGYESPKWYGKCPSCGSWNTMIEAPNQSSKGKASSSRSSSAGNAPKALKEIDFSDESRLVLGLPEVDRLLGGGIVPGSLVLLDGEPGDFGLGGGCVPSAV